MILAIFQVCFLIGVIFSAVSFVLGQVSGHFGTDGHVDFDGDLPDAILPVKPITVMSFLTVFGGVGMIGLNHGLAPWLAGSIAGAAGLVIAWLLFRWVVAPLYRAQNTSTVSQQDLIGLSAVVTLDILGERFGSIRYVIKGSTCTAPAMSVNGVSIQAGEEVVITNIVNNVFLVDRPSNLFA